MAEPAPTIAPEPAPPGGRSLAQAVITALALLAIVVVCYLLGRTAFFFLAVTVVLLALFELLDALTQKGHKPSIPFGVLCGFAMMGVAYLHDPHRPDLLAVVIAVTLFGSVLLALRPARGQTPASDAAWTVFGVIWVGGGGAGAVSILMIEPQDGTFLLIATFLSIALGDIAAYFIGTRFGKHKMAPSISPGKSWEGFLAGIFGSLAGGALFAGLLFDLSLAAGLGIGAIVALLAPAGDLVESLVKRELGIKDSGRLLPGHGGFLDRLDAIIFCCPVVYLFLRFIVF
ncbi:MAG: phosphatidate cytidylyltransferase [Actinomycetota bacterium]|nr:phosphatidate cytidylyltransferase [Actinomycetota bacterium]